MILKVVNDPLPKLTARMPAGLDAVVYRCLEKDPACRFQSIADLAFALAPYAQSPAQVAITLQRTRNVGGVPLNTAPAPALDPRAAPSTISVTDSTFSTLVTTAPRGRRWPILAVLGTLVGIGLVILVFTRGEPTDSGPSPGSRSGAIPNAVAPGVASPAVIAEPLPAAFPPRDVGSPVDRAAISAPLALDGGVLDASGATESNDAAAMSPHRPKPDDKNRHQGTTERAHATPTRRTMPLSSDRSD
jgi:serine/threonine-protein kinase